MARRVLLCFALGVLAVISRVASDEYRYCESTPNTTCCLRNNTSECSGGYFRQPDDNVTCAELTTTTTTTTTTPLPTTTDSTDSVSPSSSISPSSTSSSTSSSSSSIPSPSSSSTSFGTTTTSPTTTRPEVMICVEKCRPGYSGYQGRCHTQCPAGMEADGNNVCKEKKSFPVYIIAICGVCGGLVVIVVVVVAVVCARRHRTKTPKRRPLSELIQQRQQSNADAIDLESPSDDLKGSDKNPYVNIAYTEGLNKGIEEQHDKVLRYTRDPTFIKQNDQQRPDYVNKAVVDWNQLNKEKEELDTLPPAPPPPPGKAPEEQYLDMGHHGDDIQGEWNPEEDYENFEVSAAAAASGATPPTGATPPAAVDEEDEQEVYENTDIALGHMRKSVLPSVARDDGDDGDGDADDDSSEQEDYENTISLKLNVVTSAASGQVGGQGGLTSQCDDDERDSTYANVEYFKQ